MWSSRMIVCSLLLATAAGHGFIKSPKSRNQWCGEEIKPWQVKGSKCEGAFDAGDTSAYNYMAVLNHHGGRAKMMSKHVCGFDSEVWHGGKTPWDNAIDWPTSAISPGRTDFVWNIKTGPHFDDTDDFRYWITKPSFQFKVGTELTWDDFEDQPFCTLFYNDKTPNANPDIVPDKANAEFKTICDVPARSGRHVIYGEWGRREGTFERFHSCMDVTFGGSNPGNGGGNQPMYTPKPPMRTPTPPMRTPTPPMRTPQPPMYTPTPPAGCGRKIGEYDGCDHAPDCCARGLVCKKSNYYSQCMKENPSTPTPPRRTPQPNVGGGGGGCSRMISKWGNCHRKFNCCASGTTCHVKNQWYAQCL